MTDIVPFEPSREDAPNEPSPITVAQVLQEFGRPFDRSLFEIKLRELKNRILDDGMIVFFPIVWGTPKVAESFAADNRLSVSYQTKDLLAYGNNTLRTRRISNKIRIGTFEFDNHTAPPDPMRVRDVKERVRMVQNFEQLSFPQELNVMGYQNGISVLTDQDGFVKISLNCPYGLTPTPDSPIKPSSTLPIPFNGDFTTRVFFAAYLRTMGCDNESIYRATAFQPQSRPQEGSRIFTSDDDQNRMLSYLGEIPSLESHFEWDQGSLNTLNPRKKWIPSTELPSMEVAYKTIFSSAHFDEKGDVVFDVVPPKPQFSHPRPFSKPRV